MSKKISIIFPCYNQTSLLEQNLKYLEKQTFTDFDIVIIDDKSTENYREIISKFPNFDITYIRNDKNLGSMRNMFKTIFYNTNTPYKITLHEDDVLHPQYLEKALEILEKDKDISFVITLAEWFKNNEELEKKFTKTTDISKSIILDEKDFIRAILDGKHLMWGSVIYRESILNRKFDVDEYLKKYDILCDRPFLVSLIKNSLKVALIEDKGMFVYDHGVNDTRAPNITDEHNFNMMNFYRENLPRPITQNDYKKFITFSTNNLINSYSSINNKITFYQFIKKGVDLDLIKLRYINRIGVAGILKVVFGKKIINAMIKLIRV